MGIPRMVGFQEVTITILSPSSYFAKSGRRIQGEWIIGILLVINTPAYIHIIVLRRVEQD